jgi:hypothetical protein
MRELYASNAANIIPYCGYDIYPGNSVIRFFRGKIVTAQQITRYYNSEGDTIARIFRFSFDDGVTEDYPTLFRVRNQIYDLTLW